MNRAWSIVLTSSIKRHVVLAGRTSSDEVEAWQEGITGFQRSLVLDDQHEVVQ